MRAVAAARECTSTAASRGERGGASAARVCDGTSEVRVREGGGASVAMAGSGASVARVRERGDVAVVAMEG